MCGLNGCFPTRTSAQASAPTPPRCRPPETTPAASLPTPEDRRPDAEAA